MADNPPPKWTTDDLEIAAASSVAAPSPINHGEPMMDIDQDAEQARNSAAEALNDLANAAVVVSASSSGGTLGSSSVASSLVNDPPPRAGHVAISSAEAAAAAKQKRRPAALLTPTRRAAGGKNSHLTPNAAGPSARRSPLVAGDTPVVEGMTQNGAPVSPNVERTGDKGKGGYNSPFTTQPFVSRGESGSETRRC